MTLLFDFQACPNDDAAFRSLVVAARRRFATSIDMTLALKVPHAEVARVGKLFPELSVAAEQDPRGPLTVRFGESSSIVDISEPDTGRILISVGREFPDENKLYAALKAARSRLSPSAQAIAESAVLETGKPLGALIIPGKFESADPTPMPRLLNSIRNYLTTLGVTDFAIGVSDARVSAYSAVADGMRVESLEQALADPQFDMWVFLVQTSWENWVDADHLPVVGGPPAGKRTFVCFQGTARVRAITYRPGQQCPLAIYDRYSRREDATVFHKFIGYGGAPLPYVIPMHWFEHEDDGFGRRDLWGHRVDFDMKDLENRPETHKVVAMYGGSSVFGMLCTPEDTSSAVLEKLLNEHCTGRDLKFTVLNLGLPSGLVLQNMAAFVMFHPLIRPDIVVSLDGHDDLLSGIRGDKLMIDRYYFAYAKHIEPLSRVLNFTAEEQVPTEYCNDEAPEGTVYPGDPEASVRAYWQRKRQFKALVEAHGSQFIWGLQATRTTDVPDEARRGFGLTRVTRDVAARLMYDILRERFAPPPGTVCLDLDHEFAVRPDREKIFGSPTDMTPYGESIVGGRLAEVLIEHTLPRFLPAQKER